MSDSQDAADGEPQDSPEPGVTEESAPSAHAPAGASPGADVEADQPEAATTAAGPAASDAEEAGPEEPSKPPARRKDPGLRLTDEQRRGLSAAGRNLDSRMAADMRRMQEALRRATGVDRAMANLTRQLRASGVFEQIADRQTSMLRAALANAPDPLATEMRRIRQSAEDIIRRSQPNAARLVLEQFRALDRLTPQQLQPIEFAATAQLARSAFANSGLEMWRVAQLAKVDVARLATVQLPDLSPGIQDLLAARTVVASDLAERLAVAAPDRTLLVATATSTRAWQRYVAVTDTPHEVQMSTAAGATVSGLIGGELLLHPADADDAEEIAGDLEGRVIEPWHRGGIAAREELFVALRQIDPDVVVFIQGGWDDVDRDGPAAASKIAHCAVEAVDHTLRALAPPDDLHAWLHRDGRTPTDQEMANGRPTRRARVNYALRNRTGDAKLVQSQLDALVTQASELNARAQKLKHAPGKSSVTQARMVLFTAETVLMQLTVE